MALELTPRNQLSVTSFPGSAPLASDPWSYSLNFKYSATGGSNSQDWDLFSAQYPGAAGLNRVNMRQLAFANDLWVEFNQNGTPYGANIGVTYGTVFHNVIIQYDGAGNLEIFLDGSSVYSVGSVAPDAQALSELRFGNQSIPSGWKVSDFLFFNRVLSAGEIAQLQTDRFPPDRDFYAYFPFLDDANRLLKDYGPNNLSLAYVGGVNSWGPTAKPTLTLDP